MKTSLAPALALPVGPLSLEVPALLLSSLGEWLASHALRLQAAADDPARVLQAGAELEQLGLEMQALVHALRGARPAAAEPLDLQAAAAQALAQWQPAWQQARQRVELQAGPAVVQALDAGLLQHALDLLLGHGLAGGHDVRLGVEPLGEGLQVLRLSGVGQAAGEDELHWQLLRLLARARGWGLERREGQQAGTLDLTLILGRLAAEPEGIDEEHLPRRRLDRALRVLVLDPHEPSRVESARLLGQAGLACDCLANLDQARELLAAADPGWTALVSGIAADAPGMADFAAQLRERYGLSRWIELVDEDYRFDIAVPGGLRPARLGRQDLQNTLLPALAG
ncbi:hypothetical protein H5407_17035 [Mitsuaria sp. WAJ17]|uniref:hypothetical protein n=1 Tax=Mitsuaria sp. WAJ17 TaxID=2761452 RepID=UPI001603EA60|nr:hypothetical protein [Mitsuaria sp. WAJ17]MBB2486936.1 hypothetical protein [Mitsuaria sp. WAJ17]